MNEEHLRERYHKLDEMIKRWENFDVKYMEEYQYAIHVIDQWKREKDFILKVLNKE